jgi:hypothetical protein
LVQHTLDPRTAFNARLRTQRIAGPPFATPAAAVGFLGCVQSQDWLGAKWSLGMRVKGATDASIDAALDAGTILRTHILRPTWHLVTPEDIGWILDLTAPPILRANASLMRKFGVTPKGLTKALDIIARSLGDEGHQTRNQLRARLEQARIGTAGHQMAYIVMTAELTGLVASGVMQGKQQTYALMSERAPKKRVLAREEAVVELARRFFLSHGPCTIRRFCWWSGLTLTEVRKVREALKEGLKVQVIDGVEWFGPRVVGSRGGGVRAVLVPEYDEILVGQADLGIPRLIADRQGEIGANSFDKPLLIDGVWVGIWRRFVNPKGVDLEVVPHGKSSPAFKAAIETEVDRYRRFLGASVSLRYARR